MPQIRPQEDQELEREIERERRVEATSRMIASARVQKVEVKADIPMAVRQEVVEAFEVFLDGLGEVGLVESYSTTYEPGFIGETKAGLTRIGAFGSSKEYQEEDEEDANNPHR